MDETLSVVLAVWRESERRYAWWRHVYCMEVCSWRTTAQPEPHETQLTRHTSGARGPGAGMVGVFAPPHHCEQLRKWGGVVAPPLVGVRGIGVGLLGSVLCACALLSLGLRCTRSDVFSDIRLSHGPLATLATRC